MKGSHIFNPKNIDVLEMEDRKVWENPDEILGKVKINPNSVAADVGCGSGFFTIPLSSRVKKVYGIDVQKEMLEFLEQKIKRLRIQNIVTLLAEENEIPLENQSVDFLISVNTLHEFDDKESMIEEMRRVLNQSGTAVIVDFKKKSTGFGPPVSIRVSKKRTIMLFELKGFSLLKSEELLHHYMLVLSNKNLEPIN